MLVAIFFPFVLSSMYWILELAQQIFRIKHNMLHPEKANDDPHVLNYYTTLFNAIILLNVCRISASASDMLTDSTLVI